MSDLDYSLREIERDPENPAAYEDVAMALRRLGQKDRPATNLYIDFYDYAIGLDSPYEHIMFGPYKKIEVCWLSRYNDLHVLVTNFEDRTASIAERQADRNVWVLWRGMLTSRYLVDQYVEEGRDRPTEWQNFRIGTLNNLEANEYSNPN